MTSTTRWFSGLGAIALAGAIVAFGPAPDDETRTTDAEPATAEVQPEDGWHIVARGARIVGGYGNNFVYNGENVRPMKGHAEAKIDPETGKGKITIEIETTEESGPIHFASDKKWEGKIKIVQRLDTEKMEKARIVQEAWLHGDTGNEAPVMPKLYNYFATWGPSKIMVNGEEAVPMIGSHTMFSEQSRGEDGKIARGETVYHPMRVQDKTGFTNPEGIEFHYVAHTTEPDQNNFPPHTAWIHLHFSDVEVKSKPAGVEIPYTRQAEE